MIYVSRKAMELIMKKKNLLLITLILVAILSGCSKGSGTVKNASELNTPTKISMIYEEFNGYKEKQIRVKENEPIIVAVNIVTESGSIDAYIAKYNDTDNCSYEGHDIETSSFSVILSEQGDYTVRVDAKKHTGSYSFSWGK
jgi:hypothetical protein